MITEIKKNARGQWWFRFVSKNGRILASSETYVCKGGAQNAIELIRKGLQ